MATSSFHRRSVILPPDIYAGEEFFSRLTPRIHPDVRLADAASWQCQVDFLESITAAQVEATHNNPVGTINPIVGNWTALCACEALSDRLPLVSYIVEYFFIHDDLIEDAKEKDKSRLLETDQTLIEGLNPNAEAGEISRNQARGRQLRAKMITELIEIDENRGNDCTRLWKEMVGTIAATRDPNFSTLSDYLEHRVVDAGLPWIQSLLCFAMDFKLTLNEEINTSKITSVARKIWILVNDYFSWDKERENTVSEGGEGVTTNAIFFFMRWYSLDADAAKIMLRKEILAHEDMYCNMRDSFLASDEATEKTRQWLEILEFQTAGNFVWSMTTARYQHSAINSYTKLRAECSRFPDLESSDSLNYPISVNAARMAENIEVVLGERRYLRFAVTEHQTIQSGKGSPLNQSNMTPSFAFDHYEIILQAQRYMDTIPAENIESEVMDGLQIWYHVPETSMSIIQNVVNLLHTSLLMLDDVLDASPMKRGIPAIHTVFGVSQTISTANFLMLKAFRAVESLDMRISTIITSRVLEMHASRTQQTTVLTEEDYFTVVDGKTGSLFVLIAEMMCSEATTHRDLDAVPLMKLIGRYFQARNDCQTLQEWTNHKSRTTLPLIYALRHPFYRSRILSVLQQQPKGLTPELGTFVVNDIKAAGGLLSAAKKTVELQESVTQMLDTYEEKIGESN